jgi:hypothetical protein
MKEFLEVSIIPLFNIIAGIIGMLIGFKVYNPFAEDKSELYYAKFGSFFKFAGILMLIWGIIKLT